MKIPILGKYLEKRYSLSDLDKAMDLVIAGRPTATGVNVTSNTALNCVPYFAGVRLIAETVGQTPLIEYARIEPRGKERATNRKLYSLLHDEPNPEMSAMSFKESLQGQAITWGNAFAEIQWDQEGTPVALWPLRADCMRVGRDPETKKVIYVYRLPDGNTVTLPAYRVFHLTGFGYDGLLGYDTIYLAREAIGMALAMEEYGARFFGNGASPGGVLEHPNKLSVTAQDNLRKSWNEMHQGLSNQHRIAILEEGMKYQQVGIPPENAQFLESRKFQLDEIARLLHIPPHMIGDLEHATFSNIEHQGIEFVVYTMTPWYTRWEETCNRKLLVGFEKRLFFFEFLVDALLRGDSAARAAFYKELFFMGVLSPNDIREKENMNPIADPAGDKYFIQGNMIPIDKAGKQAPPPPVPVVVKPNDDEAPKEEPEVVAKRIAVREKQNLLRAAGHFRDDASFREWLKLFFRDFPVYVGNQYKLAADNGDVAAFTERYMASSRKALTGVSVKAVPMLTDGWEDKKMRQLYGNKDDCLNYKVDDTDIITCSAVVDGVLQEKCGKSCRYYSGG
jgi:HK97 family phage portal protein